MGENDKIITLLKERKDYIASYSVKHVVSKNKEQQSLIAITESSIFFPVLHDSKIIEENKCWWIDVSSITVVDYMAKIIIIFSDNGADKEICFTDKNYKTIGQVIADHLQRILGPVSAQKLNLSLLTKNEVNFDKESVMMRLTIYCSKNGINIPQEIIEKLKMYIDRRKVNFIFSEWGDYLPSIIFALQPYQYNISGIIDAPISHQNVEQLVNMVIPFKHISFETAITADIKSFWEKSVFECNSVAFRNTKMDSETLENMVSSCAKCNLQTLALNNAFLDSAFDVFYSDRVFKKEIISSLTYLNLDNTKGIKLPRLLWFIKYITILSLANCGFEVATTLNQLCSFDLKNLRCLNLSGNVCQDISALEGTTSFPTDLCRIDISEVEFERGCAEGLLKFIFSQEWPYGARIYANSLTIPSGDNSSLFSFFEDCQFTNLVDFAWGNNETRVGLIKFIQRNKKLVNIFMDNDFGDKSPVKIKMFSEALLNFQFLAILSVKGSPALHMSETMVPIIDSIKSISNLAVIDLSGNTFNEDLLEALSVACNMSSAISEVCLLNNECEDELLENFIKKTRTNKKVVKEEIETRNYQEFPKYITSDELVMPCCQSPPYDAFIFMPDPPPEPTPEEDPELVRRRKLFLRIVGHHDVDEDLLPINKTTNERQPVNWELDEDIIEGSVYDATQATENLEKKFSLARLTQRIQ